MGNASRIIRAPPLVFRTPVHRLILTSDCAPMRWKRRRMLRGKVPVQKAGRWPGAIWQTIEVAWGRVGAALLASHMLLASLEPMLLLSAVKEVRALMVEKA